MRSNSITVVPTDDHVDVNARVMLHGQAHAAGDPLYVDGDDRILKLTTLADLPATIGRWLLMGRSITNVYYYMEPVVDGSCEEVAA